MKIYKYFLKNTFLLLNIVFYISVNAQQTPTISFSYFDDNEIKIERSQKIVHYNDNQIILCPYDYTTNNSIYSIFYLHQNANIQSSDAFYKRYMIEGYKVTDIEVLDDTLYMCGYCTTDGITEQGGFFGYIRISELFSLQYLRKINISNIPTTKAIRKLKVYHNNVNKTVIVGIGTMNIGHIPLYSPNGTITYTPMQYFDCMVSYLVDEHSLNNNQLNICNSFDIYQCNKTNNLEKFQDIIISKNNYIGIMSLKYNEDSRIYSPNGNELYRQVYWRIFDRNTFEEQDEYFNIEWFDLNGGNYYQTNYIKGVYNIKLKDMNEEDSHYNIYQGYGHLPSFIMSFINYDSYDDKYANILNKMVYYNKFSYNYDIGGSAFCLLSTRVNENTNGNYRNVWDIGYNKYTEKLQLLKEEDVNTDAIYELDFSLIRNDFNSLYPSYTYNSTKLIPNNYSLNDRWNSILSDNNNNNNYKLLVYRNLPSANGFFLFDHNTDINTCKTKEETQIETKPYPVLFTYDGNEYLSLFNLNNIPNLALNVPYPNVEIRKIVLSPKLPTSKFVKEICK